MSTMAASPGLYTSRILPREEWSRLTGTDLESVVAMIPPDGGWILVVEDGDRIVACWGLLSVWHLEGLWIAPEHRGRASVARRLWAAMRALTRTLGIRGVMTAAVTDDVRRMLTTAGATQLPGDHYLLPLEKGA